MEGTLPPCPRRRGRRCTKRSAGSAGTRHWRTAARPGWRSCPATRSPSTTTRRRPARPVQRAARTGPRGEHAEPIMGAEDFSYVLAEVPGALAFLGGCPPGWTVGAPPNHSNRGYSTRARWPPAWPCTRLWPWTRCARERACERISVTAPARSADRAQRGSAMSELASESLSQRLREAPTERSEGVR